MFWWFDDEHSQLQILSVFALLPTLSHSHTIVSEHQPFATFLMIVTMSPGNFNGMGRKRWQDMCMIMPVFLKPRVVNCQGRWWWCVWLVHEKENKVDKNLPTGCPKISVCATGCFVNHFPEVARQFYLCFFQRIDRLILTSQHRCIYWYQILTERHLCLYISIF